MPQVLVLSDPTQDKGDPVIDFASGLITQGEQVTFFGADEFKEPLENMGAAFKSYNKAIHVFETNEESEKPKSGLISALLEPMKFIDDIVVQIRGLKFDYAILSPSYPYADIITQLLGISRTQQMISKT